MKNHSSKEALFERMRALAEVNKTSLHESKNRTLGTLIDYKRAADGVAYGIVKENHQYYIKKGGIKSDPDVSDFAYIGGLANITNYQYKSLSEADKNRNMLLHTLNEAHSLSLSRKRINEDRAEDEIGSAEARLGDLDAATASENEPDDVQMAAGLEAEPMGEPASAEAEPELPAGEPTGEPTGEPAGDLAGEPTGDLAGDEEEPAGDEELPDAGGEEAQDGESETIRELEKSIGKLTNTIRKTDLEPTQSKSYLKSLIQSFKDKLPELEIEDRKEIANMITKVVPPEDVEDLSSAVPQDNEEGMEEGACNECGSFAKYAESRGYGSADALMECGEEEVSNLVSGYANANADGMNDGDHENVALVIKLVNPEILNTLKGDYGHEEYANKLTPYVQGMNEETEEEGYAKLNELFGSLGRGIKGALGKVGGDVVKGVSDKYTAAKEKVQQYGTGVKQAYHQANVGAEMDKLNDQANNLRQQAIALATRAQKAGQTEVNVNSLLRGLGNQIITGNIDVSKTKAGSGIQREEVDPAYVQTQSLYEELSIEDFQQNVGKIFISNAYFGDYLDVNYFVKGNDYKLRGVFGNLVSFDDLGDRSDNSYKTLQQPIIKATIEDALKYMELSDDKTQSLQEEDEEIDDVEVDDTETTEEKPEVSFAPAAQSLGAGVSKPDGAPTTISVTSKEGAKVDVSLSEVVKKLREIVAEGKVKEGNAFTAKLANTPKGSDFEVGGKKMKDTSNYDKENVEESKKPSAGLSKEKKSEIVKKAKAGEDIGKKGKGFKAVEKAAKKGGAEDPKAVAAAAMWKNVKREGVEDKAKSVKKKMEESFVANNGFSTENIREYTRHRLAILTGKEKDSINETSNNPKFEKALGLLNEAIDKQFNEAKLRYKK